MEITVTLRETIKPSSPTPPHLRHLKFSLIDQYMFPSMYVRIVLFYSAHSDAGRFHTTNMSHRLRKSLSEVLTEFYPLAGRYNNNEWIDCNDDGLEYLEARVKAPFTLSHLLSTCSQAEEFDPLVPYDAYNYGGAGFRGLSAVQVTVFDSCGGMAIGISLSHLLIDAGSLATFINRWGAIARQDHVLMTTPQKPIFDVASLFPPRSKLFQTYENDVPSPVQNTEVVVRKNVTKRFVFPQTKIDKLKGEFAYERPSRVEAVSALLLKCLINVSSKARSAKSIYIGCSTNMRSRMSPTLTAQWFGNIAFQVVKQVRTGSLNGFGEQLREWIKEVDSEYLEKLKADNSLLLFEIYEEYMKLLMKDDVKFFHINSWCRFPFYEADVGWGAPTWVTPGCLFFSDCIILLDAKNGDGIEAWVSMDKVEMAKLESEDQLLDFVSLNSTLDGQH